MWNVTEWAKLREACERMRERRAGAAGEVVSVDNRRDPGADADDGEGKVVVCQLCGRTLYYTSRSMHQRTCRVWDPGGRPCLCRGSCGQNGKGRKP